MEMSTYYHIKIFSIIFKNQIRRIIIDIRILSKENNEKEILNRNH